MFSESVAARIDGEVQRKMNEAFERAKALLDENREKLDGLADLLIDRETIDRREFEAFMKGEALPAPQETEAEAGKAEVLVSAGEQSQEDAQ